MLVGTPGRLLDFVDKEWLEFDAVRFVVMDEADRMLEMGFLPDMQRLMDHPTMVATVSTEHTYTDNAVHHC